MTLDETKSLINILTTQYPNFYSKFAQEDFDLLAGLWFHAFKNVPYILVRRGLVQYMEESETGFPPPIGMVMANIKSAISDLSAEEQWDLVMHIVRDVPDMIHRAIPKYLDEIAQDLVDPNYIRSLKEGRANVSVEHSHFLKRYNERKSEKEREAIKSGNLLLVSNEQKLAQLGIAKNDLLIEHKEPDVRN